MLKKISLILFVLSITCALLFIGGCSNGGDDGVIPEEHVCIYDQIVQENEYLIKEASCEVGATYAKSCICGLSATTPENYFTTDPLGHEYGEQVISEGNGTHKKECTRTGCGSYISERCTTTKVATCKEGTSCDLCDGFISNANPINHVNGTVARFGNGDYHELHCVDCDMLIENEKCSGGEANCCERAICDGCGQAYGEFDSTKHVKSDNWIKLNGCHGKYVSVQSVGNG